VHDSTIVSTYRNNGSDEMISNYKLINRKRRKINESAVKMAINWPAVVSFGFFLFSSRKATSAPVQRIINYSPKLSSIIS
jgi:hypothetical protein